MRPIQAPHASGLAARLSLSAVSLSLLAVSCGGDQPAPRTANAEAHVSSPGELVDLVGSIPRVSEDDAVVPITMADPTWGSRRALVTVVVFGDYQCPFTGRILPTLRALEDKYGPKDLRVVWKEEPLPFHDHARSAAEAAEAVYVLGRANAFWKFWEQALLHQTDLTSASFDTWAERAGVDVPTFHRLLEAHAGSAKVDADLALAQRLHAFGTPTSFINGVAVVGAQPVDNFSKVIDEELAKAKARLGAGIASDALYADLAKSNWKAPAPADDEDEKEDTTTVFNVPVGDAPVRGKAGALVTIVEFSDFQCPYCKRVEPTLQTIRDTYGDKVRIVWKDEPLPFHPLARPAAELAREARGEKGESGFWAAHDALFEAQPKIDAADLVAIAHTLGLNAAQVTTALETKRYEAGIQADADLADDIQAGGTPHFFVNGRRLVGAQPFETFKPIIDEEIRHGEALLAAGTPPAALYDTMIHSGKGAPAPELRQIAARPGAPSKGPPGAPVVIEEFADFECPYCVRGEEAMKEVAKRYGGKVKFIWRNYPLPFHAHAPLAAEAAAEAQHQKGNTAFWAMHDKLFARHAKKDGDGTGLDRVALEMYAREIGLDMPAFGKALDGLSHRAEIDEDVRAADDAKISGTPAFIVNGVLVEGAQPFDKFKRIIDKALGSQPAKANLAH